MKTTTYIGSQCAKHPEDCGLRYKCNYGCVACGREAAIRHDRKVNNSQPRIPANPAKVAATRKAYRESDRGREVLRQVNERRKDKAKAWRLANSDHVRAQKRFHKAQRDAHINQRAKPSWADRKSIEEIYRMARETTERTGILHVVDHVIPLKNKAVCGLHVAANLKVITSSENLRKNNRFDPELIG